MAKLKLRGKDLKKIGYPEGKVIGVAINMMLRHYKRESLEHVLTVLKQVLEAPEKFKDDAVLGRISHELIGEEEKPFEVFDLVEDQKEYPVYGAANIEAGARQQMDIAMQLPITVAGALMPDAHQGYGLPIGGVLATDNVVIPYGVGVDIGCRMCLTLYDIPVRHLQQKRHELKKILRANSRFGKEVFDDPMDDAVLERPEFKEIKVVSELKDKAFRQIGSSGGGNHFVEFGEVELTDESNEFSLPTGHYLAVLSHSGSRGFGAAVAQYYTRLAREKCRLPAGATHMAWLDLNTEEGMEYWLAMNLAGDYAAACHHHIHQRIGKAIGEKPLTMVENHHNFAWKERMPNGKEVIVHRKGATPAGKGVLGIIPGSMTAPGFVVRGKGEPLSLNSASHGAGRVMSRKKAKESLTKSYVKSFLKEHGVELIGGGLDEAPMAYKDIHQVMQCQEELVDVIGIFRPKIVRMCDE